MASYMTIEFADSSYESLDFECTEHSPSRWTSTRSFPNQTPRRIQIRYDYAFTIKQRISDVTKIPSGQMRLISSEGEELSEEAELSYRWGTHVLVKWISPSVGYQAKETHLGDSTRQKLIQQINEIPMRVIIVGSIQETEVKEQLAQMKEVKAKVGICNMTDQTPITYESEELVPIRILPDHGGVECRGRYMGQYRAASQELIAAVKKYDADLDHTKKLLKDLPIALSHNHIALDTLMENESESGVSYEDIGPIIIERYRIQKEIAAQEKKLKELEANPIEIDPDNFIHYTHQTSIILRFDVTNRLDDKEYRLVPFSADPIPSESMTPIIIHPTSLSCLAPVEDSRSGSTSTQSKSIK